MNVIDFIFKWSLRLLQPKAAKRMEQDGALAMPKVSGPLPEDTEFICIDDRGADITVFAYSGLDSLFAGRARYEFRMLFRSLGVRCNLVCIRDPRTSCYHIARDGVSPGIDFYTEKTREVMEQIGSTYNVALGASSGGEAAFAFGTRCGMDKIIAFSPAFPHAVYRAPWNVVRSLFNLRNLIFEPQAYVETLIVTIATIWMEDVTSRGVEIEGLEMWDTLSLYDQAGDARPESVIYYGIRSGPDARQARMLSRFGQVKLVPVNTARHNCTAVLLKQGRLKDVLANELQFDTSAVDEANKGPVAP